MTVFKVMLATALLMLLEQCEIDDCSAEDMAEAAMDEDPAHWSEV